MTPRLIQIRANPLSIGLLKALIVTVLLAGMEPSSLSFAATPAECSIDGGEDPQGSNSLVAALFGRKSWTQERNFNWQNSLQGYREEVGKPVTRVWNVESQVFEKTEESEAFARCVLENRKTLVEALPTYQQSAKKGIVLSETVGDNLWGFKLRNKRTQQEFECWDCYLMPLSVTLTDGLEIDSIQAASVILETILNPLDLTQRTYRAKLGLTWQQSTVIKSADFIWDQKNYTFINAADLERF
jgi:hypothetical protein